MRLLLRIILLTSVIFLINNTLVYSQSLKLVQADSNISERADADEVDSYARVMNNSNKDISVRVHISVLKIHQQHSLSPCWADMCIQVGEEKEIDLEGTVALQPNDTTKAGALGFKLGIRPNGYSGVDSIKVYFINVADDKEFAEYIAVFNFTPTSVSEGDELIGNISLPQPNPANDYTSFSYKIKHNTINPVVEIYSIDGSLRRTIQLNINQNIILIDTKSLPSGTYFYALKTGNWNLTPKPFVVSH